MDKIALIYSFNTKKTTLLADKIKKLVKNTVALNAEEITAKEFVKYDKLILGVPTWFDGELPNYWDEFLPDIEDADLKGKKIAIFGLGDQKGYPENFVDGIGIMANILKGLGAEIIGYTSTKGYQFESSRALDGDRFMGFAADLDSQKKQTEERLQDWAKQIEKEFK